MWDHKKSLNKYIKEWNNITMIAVGMSRSGKSYLVEHFVTENIKLWDFIVIFSSTGGFDKIKTKFRYEEVNDALIQAFKKKYEKSKKKFRVLYIVDDLLSLSLKYKEELNKLFLTGRHYGASIIILAQKLSMLSQAWFANTTMFAILFSGSIKEKEYISENVLMNIDNKKDWIKIQTEFCINFRAIIVIPMEYTISAYKVHSTDTKDSKVVNFEK